MDTTAEIKEDDPASGRTSLVIAVCGKGGVGKTVITTLLVKAMGDNGGENLLVIDGDPALGVASTLGIETNRSVGEVREEIIKGTADGRGEELANTLDYLILSSLVEEDGFSFLAMGRTDGLGCFCPVNTILKRAITRLSRDFDIILIDAEAGIEQLNRMVISGIDVLIIVTDPSPRGFQTAGTIKEITGKDPRLRPGRMGIVINRYREGIETLEERASVVGLDVWGVVPEDETLSEMELLGEPIYRIPEDSSSLQSVKKLLKGISLCRGAPVSSSPPPKK